MNELQIFDNSEFGKIRTLEQDGKILFCGKDVAEALGYCNLHDAMIRHCKEHGVVKHEVIDNLGRAQQAKFINEGNLYRLITHSKLESAEKFEQWVFDEVLPAIRKTGSYSAPTITNENIRMISTALAKMLKQKNPAKLKANDIVVLIEEKLNKKPSISGSQRAELQRAITKRTYWRSYERALELTTNIQPEDIKVFVAPFFRAIYKDIKNKYGVTSYRDISGNDFADAIQYAQEWVEPVELKV